MKIERQREVLDLATRVDEMNLYSQYLKELIDDNILPKLPSDVVKQIKSNIFIEAVSYTLSKSLRLPNSIFNYTLGQLNRYEEELIKSKASIRAKFLNQREIILRLREQSGYNRKGEVIG